jgi:acyl-CoA reductase-like NAD-dependent aldehyde dehydrogenase
LLIGGRLEGGARRLPVVNPATEAVIARAAGADRAQADAAVEAAWRAFGGWAERPVEDRARRLDHFANALMGRIEEMALWLTLEQGKPLAAARREVTACAAILAHFSKARLPRTVVRADEQSLITIVREPLGVVAAITPWNFPLLLLAMKIGPALIAGDTVVIKPAQTTPLTTSLLGELCAEIFPPGVVNVVVDDGDLGDALTSHPLVAKVAFTGSTPTGRRVMANAASGLKRLTLELGGNDPAIVLDDADVEAVAAKLYAGATLNSGQVCFAIKRLYAPARIYDVLCGALAELARRAVVGEGVRPEVEIGPVQNRRQFERLQAYAEEARGAGAVLAGGEWPGGPGFFVPPMIVAGLPDSARLVREEQFGPILPVLKYDDLDDAIARANDSDYGLGASVWTGDADRGAAVAERVRSGVVWVNKLFDLPPDVPFGGARQSGIGVECGEEGLLAFTQTKVVNVARG